MAIENVARYTLWGFRRVKFNYFLKSFYNCKSFSSQKMKFDCEPRTAYFRKEDGSDYFSISVLVEHEPFKLNKNFTFWRPIDSVLSHLLMRIDLKISGFLAKKLKKESDREVPEVRSAMYKNEEELSEDFPCSEFFEVDARYEMKILGDSYCVKCNTPWVNEIGLPKMITTKSVVMPKRLKCSFADVESSSFSWYRSGRPAAYLKTNVCHLKDWVQVGDAYSYKVQDEDIGHYLKLVCIPRNGSDVGPEFVEICALPVTATRNDFNFITTHSLTDEKVDDSKIRIVSYNLLAGTYITTKEGKLMYDYCDPDVLDKNFRCGALLLELTGYNADLLCLQEVELSFHNEYILPRMKIEGCEGDFCPKANAREGTGVYYNTNKFKLVSSHKFAYGEEVNTNVFLKDVKAYLQQNTVFFERFCELPHSLQLVVLRSSSREDHLLVVGNVHLLSFPDADLTRLLQAISSFCLFEHVIDRLGLKSTNKKISFILCGDFNSTPECAVNELVMNGSMSADHPIWTSGEMKGMQGMSYKLPVKMDSAFHDVKFTNYTRIFKGCLDYIYYQSDVFEVSKTYPLPDEDVLSAHVGLPSVCFLSDHVPLIAELQWKT